MAYSVKAQMTSAQYGSPTGAPTHLSETHQLAYDRKCRAVGIDAVPLLEEIGDGLHRVDDEDFVAQAVKREEIPWAPGTVSGPPTLTTVLEGTCHIVLCT